MTPLRESSGVPRPTFVIRNSSASFEGALSSHIEAGQSSVSQIPAGQNGANLFAGRFSGRTAVITGGASGLGFLTAQRIMQEGGKVSIWDLTDAALETAKKALGAVHTVRVDVGNYAEVAAAATWA
jgi:NADPH:quinone reductase-like Zn-dependent oxidoreductase